MINKCAFIRSELAIALTILMLPLSSASANVVDCEFDLNDEWPLEYDRICQANPLEALLANDDSNQTLPFPLCVLPLSDPDGDGWGWENNRSCNTEAAFKATAADPSFPRCIFDSSDPDSDGWGWESQSTCITHNIGNTILNNINQKEITAPWFDSCIHISADPDGDKWGFENGKTCAVTAKTIIPTENKKPTQPKPSDVIKVDPPSTASVIYQQDFNSSTVGAYTGETLNKEWDTPFWHMGFDQGRVHIVQDTDRDNAMRVTFPAYKFGAAGATAFLTDVEFGLDLPKSYTELYVSYDVKFAEGFDFVRGGKLPGLCGYNNTQTPTKGCNTGGGFPDGTDGWSARGMWRTDGAMENYVYHANQENHYGDDEFWDTTAQPGQWHTIQHRVVLNTVGQENGILEAWFDGKKVLSKNNFVYRKTDDIGVNLFYFSTFYGGNDASWAPSEDQFIYFDNIRISTESNDKLLANDKAYNDDSTDQPSATKSGGGAFSVLLMALLLVRRRQ